MSCYSPTNARDETDLDIFNNEQSSLFQSVPKHNVLIRGGDMNAQIGKKVNNKFSLYNSSETRNIKQILYKKRDKHALIQNFRKGKENYGPTPTQIILKHW